MPISSASRESVALVMPMRKPSRSTTGPPEFLGWIGVEIWMYRASFRRPASALTFPVVTLTESGKEAGERGTPTATMSSPSRGGRASEDNSFEGFRRVNLDQRQVVGSVNPRVGCVSPTLHLDALAGLDDMRVGEQPAIRSHCKSSSRRSRAFGESMLWRETRKTARLKRRETRTAL